MKSLGRYSLYCYTSAGQLQEYFDIKYKEFLDENPNRVKTAASCVGLQNIQVEDKSIADLDFDEEDLKVWVLNPYMHTTADGTTLTMEESPFIWLGELMKRTLKSGTANINVACFKYASTSNTVGVPLSHSTFAMNEMVSALRNSNVNNFPSALMVIGSQLLLSLIHI